MKTISIGYRLALIAAATAVLAAFTACGQYRSPITDQATRKLDATLIGDWVSSDRKVRIKIRELTETSYVVTYNGVLFKAFHSDFERVPFISLQELETSERSFTYLAYRTSDYGAKLYLRLVNKEVIPDDITDSATVRGLLKNNLQNPALFHKEQVFMKENWSLSSTAD